MIRDKFLTNYNKSNKKNKKNEALKSKVKNNC